MQSVWLTGAQTPLAANSPTVLVSITVSATSVIIGDGEFTQGPGAVVIQIRTHGGSTVWAGRTCANDGTQVTASGSCSSEVPAGTYDLVATASAAGFTPAVADEVLGQPNVTGLTSIT